MKRILTEEMKTKYKNQQKEHRLQLVTALVFIGAGTILGRFGQLYDIRQQQTAEALERAQILADSRQPEPIPETKPAPEPAEEETKSETEPETEPAFQPSPDKLNLAYYYPEDQNSGEIIDSYAGQVFQELTILDSEWLADIYELADVKPAAMAKRLGKSPDSVLGTYNPKDDAHDPDDPSTWTIHNWKRIHVTFSDGNGRNISSFSNVKDILSMASVYTYYTDMMDVDAFSSYARQLWENSHSYTLKMGDVYYCDGCMNKTDEEIAMEEEMEEEAAAALSGEAAAMSGETQGNDLTEAASASAGSPADLSEGSQDGVPDSSNLIGIHENETGEAGQSASGASDSLSGSGGAAETAAIAAETAAMAAAETAATAAAKTAATETAAEAAETAAETAIETAAETAAETGTAAGTDVKADSESVTIIHRNTLPDAAAYDTPGDSSASAAIVADPENESSASEAYETASGSDASAMAASSDHVTGSSTLTTLESAASGAIGSQAESAAQNASQADMDNQKASGCPGHVDLYIQVKLLGLEKQNGLIAADAIGNDSNMFTPGGWEGWNEEAIAYVNSISSQDWFKDYGLSVSAISLSTPLSGQEIADYMAQLPDDLSETRREIIHFALSSVGKVPYYYGGKASHAGYEGNNFGALVPPDHKGRILKGLDCSGWIHWVYWSVTGKHLAGSSTSSLALCGEKISRSDLKPGDIVIRTGTSAHVVMFLSWSADGRMNVIHESSASVNNITIKTMEAAWPYYRRLVD